MKRFILALGISSVLSGCAGLLDKQDPICSGVPWLADKKQRCKFMAFVRWLNKLSIELVIRLTGSGSQPIISNPILVQNEFVRYELLS